MPEFLFELGCEELPASFVRRAYEQLEQEIVSRLNEVGLGFNHSSSLGTPRRLIVVVQGLQAMQPDQVKELRGPGIKAAYDPSGAPTKALEGFCRSQGVSLAEVRAEGEYVWGTQNIPGKATKELLAEILPEAVRSLSFEKTMRWGASRIRFARPIRWLLACFDGDLVEFSVEGVRSGLSSRGHRFEHPEAFQVGSFEDLVGGLRTRLVEPVPAEREKRIRDGALAVCSGEPQLTDALVDENVFLTEWPSALEGEFKAEYLELPEPVLITAMAKHERFFPVRGSDGRLTNKFISIRGGGVDEVVREGNAWVLNARFNDAQFFYEEDQKHSLDAFLEKTSGMIFQEKLGTVRQRAERLAGLARFIAEQTGADEREARFAEKAGLYAKADLSTGLVSELPSLQGIIGAEYAEREGFEEEVCWAIRTHYDIDQNQVIDSAAARTAIRLLMADQIDKLTGFLAIGLEPSGTSDPYGLRRAAGWLIEAARRWPTPIDFYPITFQKSYEDFIKFEGVTDDGLLKYRVSKQLVNLFQSRYENLFPLYHYSLLIAALTQFFPEEGSFGSLHLNPQEVKFRMECLSLVAADKALIHTATRPINLVIGDYQRISETFQIADLSSPDGVKLWEVYIQVKDNLLNAKKERLVGDVLRYLKSLEPPINAFLDSTMIMVQEESIRMARLSLLKNVTNLFLEVGDFSKIVIED